jgi:hypothetical protein
MRQSLKITFGNYSLDSSHNILLDGWREIHGAERDVTVLKTVGTRGVIVLNAKFNGKVLEVTGGIECTEPIQEARDFLLAMSREGQPLMIENDEGTFVYDGAYVINIDDAFPMKDLLDARLIKFRLLFLCPRGFARSTTQVTQTSNSIASAPYSGSITIDGDTSPEPIINITLVDVSGITDLFFTNLTTNQQINITDQTFADGDIVSFDTENKRVTLNGTAINFNGVFPDFIIGINNYQLTVAGTSSLVVDQQQYNAEEILFGNNWLGQSFQVSGAQTISQLGLLIKRVNADVLSLYDDFNDNSIDATKWNTSGQVEETGGRLRLYERRSGTDYTSIANTDNKTAVTPPGEPVTGFQVSIPTGFGGGGSDGREYEIGVTDGTFRVWFVWGGSTGKMVVRQSGGYYGGSTDLTGQFNMPSTVSMRQVGSDILFYADTNLVLTLTGKTVKANSRLLIQAYRSSGSSGADAYFEVDNVYVLTSSNDNSDITVTIETDATGEPSGTPVANGSLTIAASEIGTDSFTDIIKEFATAPSLSSATTYHVVIKQTGGDINNYYIIKKQNTAVLANGNLQTTPDAGSNWTQVTTEDLYVKLWNAFPSGFDLEMDIMYFPSYLSIG